MEIEHLELLCTIAQTKSLSEAGRVHTVSQSAVSQILSQLEKRVGVTFFDRSKRPLALTEEGRMFIGGLQPILQRYRALEEEIVAKQREVKGAVRMAAIYSAGHLRLGRVLQEFGKRYPKAKVQLSYLHPAEIYNRVLFDEVDLGIVSCPERKKGLSVTPWIEQEMALIVPAKGPLSEIERCSRKELQNLPFISFAKGLAIRRMIDLYLRHQEIKVKVAAEFDNIDTMKAAVEEGLGVSILPVDCLTRESSLGILKIVPCAKPLSRPLGIVQREGAPILRVRAAMIDLLQEGQGALSLGHSARG